MTVAETPPLVDLESREWLSDLRAGGATADAAVARLHALLLRAARFELTRRRGALPHLRGEELEHIAHTAADDALVGVLEHLDDFGGASRFTTWASKFALVEAAVKVRRRTWRGRELPAEPQALNLTAAVGPEPDAAFEERPLLTAVQTAVDQALTPHQRRVLVALVVEGVPIDVLAERMETTRGALYETLRAGRRKVRALVAASGLDPAG